LNLPVTFADTKIYIALPFHHGDPFDRMLIAQAMNYFLIRKILAENSNSSEFAWLFSFCLM
jgi:PIN domain nuclease of toxin-antitoxin system